MPSAGILKMKQGWFEQVQFARELWGMLCNYLLVANF
jgi:hypothetical protein